MREPTNDYSEPAPGYADVIEKSIADWLGQQKNPLALPLHERAIGSLALLITKRLIQAGLIDPDRKKEHD